MNSPSRWIVQVVHGLILGTLLAAAILNLLAAGAGARLFYYQGF